MDCRVKPGNDNAVDNWEPGLTTAASLSDVETVPSAPPKSLRYPPPSRSLRGHRSATAPVPFSEFRIFAWRRGKISIIDSAIPSHLEGRLAIVTNAGRDAMDAGGAKDDSAILRTAKACGPDPATLGSSLR
jgi:hypothetical protein